MTENPKSERIESVMLDEIERLHSEYDKLSLRISRVEERMRGQLADPMQTVMLWCAVAYAVSLIYPMLRDLLFGASERAVEVEER
jgi:hypothetical protein